MTYTEKKKKLRSKLSRGETVMVYYDPMTKTQVEGEFVLYNLQTITKISSNTQLERWTGRFYGDDCAFERVFLTEIEGTI